MYERMLDKANQPTLNQMTSYCGETAEMFTELNNWLSSAYQTAQQIVFPYGNKYGWGISHKIKTKLICTVFAENGAFSVMLRLTNKQCASVYDKLQEYSKNYVDNKYPCSDGGWIHYRVTSPEHLADIKILLASK